MDDKPLETVVAELTHETTGWTSLDARFTFEQTLFAAVGTAPAGTHTRGREEYRATRQGERKYTQFIEVEDREACVLAGYDTTDRCTSIRYARPPEEHRQTSILISKDFLDEATTGFRAIPAPLPYYVGLKPIHEAIRTAERVGPSQVAGRNCTRFYFARVEGHGGTEDLVYHLDASTSFPLKVEAFTDWPHFDAAAPFSVWQADTIDEAQGFHFAADSRFSTFTTTASGKPIPELINKYPRGFDPFQQRDSGSHVLAES